MYMDDFIAFLVFVGVVLLIAIFVLPVVALVKAANAQSKLAKISAELQELKKALSQLKSGEDIALNATVAPMRKDSIKAQQQNSALNQAAIEPPAAPPPSNADFEQRTTEKSVGRLNKNIYSSPAVANAAAKQNSSDNAQSAAKAVSDKANLDPQDTQFDEMGAKFKNWLMQNLVAKIAVVILFFGISFLLKYSIEKGYITPEIRTLGSLILGFALFGIGWSLRAKNELFSLILQGGAIGVLYITIFAAFSFYGFIPSPAAFALFLILCTFGVFFAIKQNAVSLATLAFVGAYLSPILASTGEGRHVVLFGCYTIVSLALVSISKWRSWRVLNLIGFAFTVIVTALWFEQRYVEEFYPETQIFLIANMLIYGILAVLLFARQEKQSRFYNVIDVALLFGVPLVGFWLQYNITQKWEFAPSFAALGFALFYFILSFAVFKKFAQSAKKTAFYMLFIGIAFATLAVPLAFDSDLTALIWLFEGSALSWAALRNNQPKLAYFGLLIVAFGLASMYIAQYGLGHAYYTYYDYDLSYGLSLQKVATLGGASSILVLFLSVAFYRFKEQNQGFKAASYALLFAAAFCWINWISSSFNKAFWNMELSYYRIAAEHGAIVLSFVIGGWIWYFIGRKFEFEAMKFALFSMWAVIIVSILITFTRRYSLWLDLGYIAAFLSAYLYLYKFAAKERLNPNFKAALYISLLWVSCLWAFGRLFEVIIKKFIPYFGYGSLKMSLYIALFGIIILKVCTLKKLRVFPFREEDGVDRAYMFTGLAPVVFIAAIFMVFALGFDGQTYGLQYIPILNPLEEAALLLFAAFGFYLLRISQMADKGKVLTGAIFIVLLFLWANAAILRSISAYFDIPYDFYHLWNNSGVQILFSFIWTILSLALIIISKRKSSRAIWVVGMVFLDIVLIKLVFHDSVALAGLYRAFVFIGVALLMLLIGFLAPIPPKNKRIENV